MDISNDVKDGAVIHNSVAVGKHNIFNEYVVVKGNVEIGSNNYFAPGVKIGGLSRQILGPKAWENFQNKPGKIIIGNNNIIFENVSIHTPMIGDTKIEDNVSIGASCHVGHDVLIRSHAILNSHISMGGYTIIGAYSNIGLGVSIHPRSVIGAYSMVGMGAVVKGYVMPGTIVVGVPSKLIGINHRGLNRYKVSRNIVNSLIEYQASSSRNNNSRCEILENFEDDCRLWQRNDLNLRIVGIA